MSRRTGVGCLTCWKVNFAAKGTPHLNLDCGLLWARGKFVDRVMFGLSDSAFTPGKPVRHLLIMLGGRVCPTRSSCNAILPIRFDLYSSSKSVMHLHLEGTVSLHSCKYASFASMPGPEIVLPLMAVEGVCLASAVSCMSGCERGPLQWLIHT